MHPNIIGTWIWKWLDDTENQPCFHIFFDHDTSAACDASRGAANRSFATALRVWGHQEGLAASACSGSADGCCYWNDVSHFANIRLSNIIQYQYQLLDKYVIDIDIGQHGYPISISIADGCCCYLRCDPVPMPTHQSTNEQISEIQFISRALMPCWGYIYPLVNIQKAIEHDHL